MRTPREVGQPQLSSYADENFFLGTDGTIVFRTPDNASAITALLPRVSIKPAMNQCAFSIAGHSDDLWGRDDATREACKANNMAYAAYSPLGGWAKHGTGHVLNDPTVKAVAAACAIVDVALALTLRDGSAKEAAEEEKTN